MKTLLIGKQKGGVGASTLVRELAVAAASQGSRVVLLDLDPQRTTAKWWNRRTTGEQGTPNPNLADVAPGAVPGLLKQLRPGHDLVIIDMPPSIHPYVGNLMRHADWILVPTRPTTDDLDALPAVIDLITAAGKATAWSFVLVQGSPGRSRLSDDAFAALARRGRVGPPLRLRMDFPASATEGRTATEMAPTGKAASEVAALWDFVATDLLQMPASKAQPAPLSDHSEVTHVTLVNDRPRIKGRKRSISRGA